MRASATRILQPPDSRRTSPSIRSSSKRPLDLAIARDDGVHVAAWSGSTIAEGRFGKLHIACNKAYRYTGPG
jgi:hypothetical protein